MPASRTGGTVYLRNRARLMRQSQADGITRCPGYTDEQGVEHPCGVELDYDTPYLPNSAEADHIIRPKYGGTDAFENLRLLCRRQNLERNRLRPPVPVAAADDFPLLREW